MLGKAFPNGGTWYYYTWNNSSFTGVSTGIPYDTLATAFALADTNGDGLPDLVSMTLNPSVGVNAAVYIRVNTSSGGAPSFGAASAAYTNTDNTGDTLTNGGLRSPDIQHAVPIRRLDFNGDGREDLVLHLSWRTPENIHYTTAYQLLGNGSTFIGLTNDYAASGYFINWNDDQCTDSIIGNTLELAGCNGTPGTKINLSATPAAVIDWDGSGREAFLYNSGGQLYVQPSTGAGLGTPVATGIAFTSSANYMGADINGDGLDDLLTWVSSGSTLTYNLHNGGAQQPDLLSSITDGYGNSASPTYVSLVQAVNSYYFEWNDAQYPYQNYLGPLYLVNQTTFSDPSNQPSGTYQKYDFYAGAWTNLQGRGFSGFGNFQVHDMRNGIWETFGYGRAFPYTGMLNSDLATQNNTPAETIFNRSYTLSDTTLDGTQYNQRYFPYVSSSTEKDYEVGGSANGALMATKTGNYSYDSYGNMTSASQTVADNDSGSPYVGESWTTSVTNTPEVNAGTWCLNLFSESQISYSASNGSAGVTRTRQYTPDTTNCRYTQIVTEPSSGSYEVTEALGYDSFGNINDDTVTGIGMAARQSSANWGSTGQFPMSVTDATNATTQFNYDFRYGLVSSETDPNGLATTWQYNDGFGRVTQELRPDKTFTTYAYALASPQWDPLSRLYVTQQINDSSGGLINTIVNYYDMSDRPLYRMETLLGGNNSWLMTQYYDSMGRLREECPPVWQNTPASNCTVYGYDAVNRVTQVQRPINQNDSTLQTTSYAYAGDTTTITDPYGHTKTLTKDVNGWLREAKDALGYTVILGYDAAGAKTSVTDNLGSNLWSGTYAYGISAFLIGENDVDRGNWGYTVDALGERTAWTDPKGQHFNESYDALSRPLSRTEPDLFTQWTWGSSAANHNIGKLASVCTGTGGACSSSYYSESETYDNLGRPYQRAIAIPSMGTYTYTWQYNATTGLLDTLTYPVSTSGQALQLKYAYQNGILQSITDVLDSPNVTVWQADTQNPDGQITQETFGNGLVATRTYDAVTHWLQSALLGPGGGSSTENLTWLYDEMGDVTQRQDNNLGLTENFYYDNDYRLSYSTLNGTQNLSLNYDPMGNITSRSDVASGATWTYDPVHLHQVTQAGSSAYKYIYDVNGNMTSRQGSTVVWTSYNYPTQINDTAVSESVSFAYGPNRQAWKTATTLSGSTEQAYHVGGLLDVVINGGVTDYRHYIYAGAQPVAILSRKSSGTKTAYYLFNDHQGSIAAITNGSGALVTGESFTAYGERRNSSTWSGSLTSFGTINGITRHGYTFQEALGSRMALNDMVGRVQDAITGRFLSADPYIDDDTNSQGYNRYSYVHNNPLTATDPSGFGHVSNEWLVDTNMEPSGAAAMYAAEAASTQQGVTVTASQITDAEDLLTNQILNAIQTGILSTYAASNTASGAGSIGGSGAAAGSTGATQQSNPQQSNPPTVAQLQTVQVTATKIGLAPSEPPLVTSFFGLDDLLGQLQNEVLNALGCESESCHALAAIVITAVAPEVSKGKTGEYTLTQTVENNLGSRPYLNSPLTIQEIQSTGLGVPDPGGLPDALRYDVPGSFNGSNGAWQLVVDPNTNTVYHFLFTSGQ